LIKGVLLVRAECEIYPDVKNRISWNLKRDYSFLRKKVGRGLISVGDVSGISLHNWRMRVFFASLGLLQRALASPYGQSNFWI